MVFDFLDQFIKDNKATALVSWITCYGRNQLSCHEETQAV